MTPDFLIIPFSVISDTRLCPLDRNVYGVIYWFHAMKDGVCKASNARIAKILNANIKSISDSLLRLEQAGKIRREFKDKDKKIRKAIVPLIMFGGQQEELGEENIGGDEKEGVPSSDTTGIRQMTDRVPSNDGQNNTRDIYINSLTKVRELHDSENYTPKPPKVVKPPKKPLSFVKRVMDYYAKAYKNKFGKEPPIVFGKDGAVVKSQERLLKNDNWQNLIDEFLESDKAEECSYTLSVCFSADTITRWQTKTLVYKPLRITGRKLT